MKKLYSFLAGYLLVGGAFAQTTRYIDNIFQAVTVTSDITYGTGKLESGTVTDLKCDIYTPTGDTETQRSLIILGHGGSLIANYGDKTDAYMQDFANNMAKKGYVVAAITYREGWAFSPLNTQEQNSRAIIPAVWRAIQDYKTAIRFFRKSAIADGNPYGIKEDLIVGAGFGVGGYLPMNAMLIDVPAEVMLPELQQKDPFGDPTGVPYIDSTKADLGGIYNTDGGSPGYSFRVDLVVNISGAIATIKELDQGINPLIISLHSDEDEATPYKTDVVKAAGQFPVIEVSGSYVVSNELYNRGINTFWEPEQRDGLPQATIADNTNGPLVMYDRGLYTFLNQPYLWSTTTDTYTYNYVSAVAKPFVDTASTFSAYRIEKWLREQKGLGVKEITYKNNDGSIKIYPNPAKENIVFTSTEVGNPIREIEFFDVTGKIAKQVIVINNDARINIQGLPTGVYTVKIYTDHSVITDKLVVE